MGRRGGKATYFRPALTLSCENEPAVRDCVLGDDTGDVAVARGPARPREVSGRGEEGASPPASVDGLARRDDEAVAALDEGADADSLDAAFSTRLLTTTSSMVLLAGAGQPRG